MSYDSKRTGAKIEELLSLAETALQSVPSEYVTETELTNKGYATTLAMNTALAKKADLAIVSQSSSTISAAAPNTVYVITSASAGAVTVSALTEPSTAVAKYTVMFTGATSLTLPSGVLWANGTIPEIDSSAHYELSIAATKIASGTVYKAVLAAFSAV